jgi:hypothetical protein
VRSASCDLPRVIADNLKTWRSSWLSNGLQTYS